MIRIEISGPVAWRRQHLKAFVKAFEHALETNEPSSLLFADNLDLDDANARRQFAREVVRLSRNGAAADAVERDLLGLYEEWQSQCPRPDHETRDSPGTESKTTDKAPNQATVLVQLV